MSKPAFTVKVFGYYLVALGIALIVVPNLLLTSFRLPPTPEVWIRVVGVVVFELGICYIYAAKCEATALFQATVFARVFVFAAFVAFAALGLVSPLLIGFGAADLASSVWTQLALRADRRAKAPSAG